MDGQNNEKSLLEPISSTRGQESASDTTVNNYTPVRVNDMFVMEHDTFKGVK